MAPEVDTFSSWPLKFEKVSIMVLPSILVDVKRLFEGINIIIREKYTT